MNIEIFAKQSGLMMKVFCQIEAPELRELVNDFCFPLMSQDWQEPIEKEAVNLIKQRGTTRFPLMIRKHLEALFLQRVFPMVGGSNRAEAIKFCKMVQDYDQRRRNKPNLANVIFFSE